MNVQRMVDKAGGVQKVADELGISHQAIYKWVRDGYIPLKRIRAVATLAGVPANKIGDMVP